MLLAFPNFSQFCILTMSNVPDARGGTPVSELKVCGNCCINTLVSWLTGPSPHEEVIMPVSLFSHDPAR